MSDPAPEFSRIIPLAWLGPEPFRRRIEATAQERQKLRERFELPGLDRLVAEVEIRRQSGETILLKAEFEAEFEQSCALTLEPLKGIVADRFSLVYGPARDEQPEIVLSADEPAFQPLTGDAIDIGEAVAQELALVLPEFPRDPTATIDEFCAADPLEGPFSALARLKRSSEW